MGTHISTGRFGEIMRQPAVRSMHIAELRHRELHREQKPGNLRIVVGTSPAGLGEEGSWR